MALWLARNALVAGAMIDRRSPSIRRFSRTSSPRSRPPPPGPRPASLRGTEPGLGVRGPVAAVRAGVGWRARRGAPRETAWQNHADPRSVECWGPSFSCISSRSAVNACCFEFDSRFDERALVAVHLIAWHGCSAGRPSDSSALASAALRPHRSRRAGDPGRRRPSGARDAVDHRAQPRRRRVHQHDGARRRPWRGSARCRRESRSSATRRRRSPSSRSAGAPAAAKELWPGVPNARFGAQVEAMRARSRRARARSFLFEAIRREPAGGRGAVAAPPPASSAATPMGDLPPAMKSLRRGSTSRRASRSCKCSHAERAAGDRPTTRAPGSASLPLFHGSHGGGHERVAADRGRLAAS